MGGDKALSWVKAQNAQTIATLEAAPGFAGLKAKFVSVLDSRERIPHVAKLGSWYYNFWRDAEHVRGVWRRTTLDEYRKPDPRWEIVLDLDQLAKREGESWVWKGAQCLYPQYDRCLLSLSRGGGDAVVVREFSVDEQELHQRRFPAAGSEERRRLEKCVEYLRRDRLREGVDDHVGLSARSARVETRNGARAGPARVCGARYGRRDRRQHHLRPRLSRARARASQQDVLHARLLSS